MLSAVDRTRPTVSAAAPLRSVPARVAVDLALREADRLGASLRTERLGPGNIVSRLVRDGTGLASGRGNGSGDQALASAHFEALERYLMSAPDNRRLAPGAARLVTAREVAGQSALGADLVVQRWAAEFPDTVAACTAYGGHGGISGTVWYPLFLSDPRYFRNPLPGDSTKPYRSLLRYSSSLGTAAGVDRDEAALHGLCELIEHDAVSHALLRWFIAADRTADVIEPARLPEPLRDLHDEARAVAGAPVHLFDVTTDLGIPAYLAVADRGGPRPAHAGAGASPLAGHAARRALDELIQTTL